jgi:CelD/BcsL family acetyltransferase involved in cellulose biosynthesis
MAGEYDMSMKSEQQHDLTEPVPTLQVVEIDPQTDPRWEAFISTLPDSLIYQHPAWLQVLEGAFGYKPVNLACENSSGQLQGILPLYYLRGLFTGRRYSSLPRTPVAGPLAYNDQALTALTRAAFERVRDERGAQLQLKVPSNKLEGLVEGVVGVPWREAYLLKLPERPELLHIGNSRNHARIKWAVNKATRLGVKVHPADTERELRLWYELYLETMRRIAVPPRPYYFFEILWKRLQPRGLMRLLLAKHYEAGCSRLLAGSLFLMFGQTIIYAFAGWRREDLSLRPNDAIHWQAIHDACAEGFSNYDFGEVTKDNQGLAEFKSKWGAEPYWLYRYYYPTPREMEMSILDSHSRARQLMSAAWRRLPIKATAFLSNLAHHYF